MIMEKSRREAVEYLKSFPHKDDVSPDDWDSMRWSVILIAMTTVEILVSRGAPVLFSSLIRDGIPGISVSKSHAEGRAFDLSVRGLTVDDIDAVLYDVNRAHAVARGAISLRDKVARAIIYEHRTTDKISPRLEKYTVINQATPHLHGQCRA